MVRLLDTDPALASAVAAEDRPSARRRLIAHVEFAPRGRAWSPPTPSQHWLGLLVIDGALARQVRVCGRWAAELLGAGDVLRPWHVESFDTINAKTAVAWTSLSTARLAILEGDVLVDAPGGAAVLRFVAERFHQRAAAMSLQTAINALPRLEDRLLVTLWRVAERWGRVHHSEIDVPLPITHTLLARMLGADRTSVSSRLARLGEAGLVGRRRSGEWTLDRAVAERIERALRGLRA